MTPLIWVNIRTDNDWLPVDNKPSQFHITCSRYIIVKSALHLYSSNQCYILQVKWYIYTYILSLAMVVSYAMIQHMELYYIETPVSIKRSCLLPILFRSLYRTDDIVYMCIYVTPWIFSMKSIQMDSPYCFSLWNEVAIWLQLNRGIMIRVSYGVFFASYTKQHNCDISRAHCKTTLWSALFPIYNLSWISWQNSAGSWEWNAWL